jgi:hypothetical protein
MLFDMKIAHLQESTALRDFNSPYDRYGSWSCDNALTGAPNNWGLLQKGAQLLHVWIAAISGLMPTMFMTRVRL